MAGCSTCEARSRLANPSKYTPEEIAEANRVIAETPPVPSQKFKSLGEMYGDALKTPGDIDRHCPKLKELASECDHVTDIGMRIEHSTIALLAGQPKRMVSLSPMRHLLLEAVPITDMLKGRTDFKPVIATTPEWDMEEETDLLFLDTKHNANQIYAELVKYAGKVRRYIVRHDTTIFGEVADSGGPGLRHGIRQFLQENPQWSVIYDTDLQHGLMVLGRDSRDKPDLPSLLRMGVNFAKHVVRTMTEGSDLVSDEVFHQRLDICALCPMRVGNQCSVCGCYLDKIPFDGKPGKASYAVETCPLPEPKWTAVPTTPSSQTTDEGTVNE